jgi:hypothetical protein
MLSERTEDDKYEDEEERNRWLACSAQTWKIFHGHFGRCFDVLFYIYRDHMGSKAVELAFPYICRRVVDLTGDCKRFRVLTWRAGCGVDFVNPLFMTRVNPDMPPDKEDREIIDTAVYAFRKCVCDKIRLRPVTSLSRRLNQMLIGLSDYEEPKPDKSNRRIFVVLDDTVIQESNQISWDILMGYSHV